MEANRVTKKNLSPVLVWSKLPFWIRDIAIAAFITISIHLSLAFIVRGRFFTDFDITDAIELPFSFLYILALFWIYPWISRMIHSSFLSRVKKVYVKFIEGFTVVVTTVLLTLLVRLFPLWLALLFINSVQDDINLGFSPDQVRRSFIIHAIIGLFFYYFVERQRIRKQSQQQQLQQAKLQKEKFRVDLENLKNQVNPKFLFNSLNFLDVLIQKDSNQAEEFVNRLSNVYRLFLKTQDELISLKEEMNQLEDYLYLVKFRFKNNINFVIDLENEASELMLPPGSVQALVENLLDDINMNDAFPMVMKLFTHDKLLILEFNFHNHKPSNTQLHSALQNLNERYMYFTDKRAELKNNDRKVEIPLLKLEIIS